MDIHPYYKRKKPKKTFDYTSFAFDRIDFSNCHLQTFYANPNNIDGNGLTVTGLANNLINDRTAAVIRSIIIAPEKIRSLPGIVWISTKDLFGNNLYQPRFENDYADGSTLIDIANNNYYKDLLDVLNFDPSATKNSESPDYFYHANPKCLAALVFADYFSYPDYNDPFSLRSKVSIALQSATPGWCGSVGIDQEENVASTFDTTYDMGQCLFLIPIAYAFYDEISSAQTHLIESLLGGGLINTTSEGNPNVSSGPLPDDWPNAGFRVEVPSPADDVQVSLPESENHILMIGTVRYLTNQLLYQRKIFNDDGDAPSYDNRRNGCMQQILSILRNQLRNDFIEYNAKNYQEETRSALLDLYSYAYDGEVHLAAKMVLDYISGHIVSSSNDVRRLVPFRRRNENCLVWKHYDYEDDTNSYQETNYLDVSLTDATSTDDKRAKVGADPMTPQFAFLSGNTRTYEDITAFRLNNWSITSNFAPNLLQNAICDYQLPPLIHDLFLNDNHRLFYQRLHRRPLNEETGQYNCENLEIYFNSPSFSISAGGKPSTYTITPITRLSDIAQYIKGDFLSDIFSGDVGAVLAAGALGAFFGGPIGAIAGAAIEGLLVPNISLGEIPEDGKSAKGVAVPISFIPTGINLRVNPNYSDNLIQISYFSDAFGDDNNPGGTINYGVAPNFFCGYDYYFPDWTGLSKKNIVFENSDGCYFINSRKSLSLRQLAGLVGLSPFSTTIKAIVNKISLSNSALAQSFIVDGYISLRKIFNSDIGSSLNLNPSNNPPGFFLAVIKSSNFIVIESFDTWLKPEVSFEEFQKHVYLDNPTIFLDIFKFSFPINITIKKILLFGDTPSPDFQKDYVNARLCKYTTYGENISSLNNPTFKNGNTIEFIIWNKPWQAVVLLKDDNYTLTDNDKTLIKWGNGNSTDNYNLTYLYPFNHKKGSKILNIEYNSDLFKKAGNYDDVAAIADTSKYKFLSGNLMNSDGEGCIVIQNPYLNQSLTLDWSNPNHLIRIDEDGFLEQAGTSDNGELYEVWVDFSWRGEEDGDFFHPCKTVAHALNKVANGGVIKIAPGTTTERINITKRVKIVKALSDVVISAN